MKNMSSATQPIAPESPNEVMRVIWFVTVVYKNRKAKKAKNE